MSPALILNTIGGLLLATFGIMAAYFEWRRKDCRWVNAILLAVLGGGVGVDAILKYLIVMFHWE
jgi:hypothetical protein